MCVESIESNVEPLDSSKTTATIDDTKIETIVDDIESNDQATGMKMEAKIESSECSRSEHEDSVGWISV